MVIQVQADLAPSLRGYSSLYEEFIMIWFRSCSGVFGINLQRLISAQRFKTMFTDYWNSHCLPHVGHTTRWHTREQCKTHSSKEFSFFFRRKLNYSFTHSISIVECLRAFQMLLLLLLLLLSWFSRVRPTLCDPIDGSPPGFPIPGILRARTLEWVAISFSSTL